eukprot:TRINITY_DN8278_c0_g1_i1.p1 TRINITY_DN8278_c0_g1~~TRINITY_DN8278_c0_g1_i1.p1  ORF type:complete len:583 (+),score=92.89 TRINITY_DN8278_c0_g1_i1:41-1750(+)
MVEDAFPDIHDLFRDYDNIYFSGKLLANGTVSVQWSSGRMTLCAGLCEYLGRSGGCVIKLSKPLLQFRPISDLKNTLLHEMIHAILFISNKNTDHDGHGAEFQHWMKEINSSRRSDPHRPSCGYDITVFHTFHTEVDHFRTHHWECSRCKQVIKRAMNRPPSEKDCAAYRVDGRLWKHDGKDPSSNRCGDSNCATHNHLRLCGGNWVKTASPGSKGNVPTIPDLFAKMPPKKKREPPAPAFQSVDLTFDDEDDTPPAKRQKPAQKVHCKTLLEVLGALDLGQALQSVLGTPLVLLLYRDSATVATLLQAFIESPALQAMPPVQFVAVAADQKKDLQALKSAVPSEHLEIIQDNVTKHGIVAGYATLQNRSAKILQLLPLKDPEQFVQWVHDSEAQCADEVHATLERQAQAVLASSLREAQDGELEEASRVDRLRKLEALIEKQRQISESEHEERQALLGEEDGIWKQRCVAARKAMHGITLPPDSGSVQIACRLADGTRLVRKFAATEPMGTVVKWVDSAVPAIDTLACFKLVTSFPVHTYEMDPTCGKPLGSDENLCPRAVLNLVQTT